MMDKNPTVRQIQVWWGEIEERFQNRHHLRWGKKQLRSIIKGLQADNAILLKHIKELEDSNARLEAAIDSVEADNRR